MNRFFIVPLVLFCGLWVGCGQQSKTVTGPDGSKATVTQKGDGAEVKFTGANGDVVRVAGGESGVALPEGFPNDVPIYAGAKVTAGAKTKEMTTAILTTSDSAKKVIDFYGEKLKANGWSIQGTMNVGEGGMVTATKGKSSCTVNVSRGEEQTTVALGVAATKE